MPTQSIDPRGTSSSLLHTSAKAGAAFARSTIEGGLLAVLLGAPVFFYYIGQMHGPGLPAAHTGGIGALLALLFSPPALVAILLALYGAVYLFLGLTQGRARAINQFVVAHGATISRRLAGVIAGRIEAMPRVHGALQAAPAWLTGAGMSQAVAAVFGESKVLARVIGFVLSRLPLSDWWSEWQQLQPATGEATEQGMPDPALRALLTRRIDEVLQNFSTPSRNSFYIALAGHAFLLGVGLWLAH